MTDIELCYLSATEILKLFRTRKLSPVDLMTALFSRIEKINPSLNAFTQLYPEEAFAAAKAAEHIYAKKDGHPRPLEGIPIAIKDFHSVKGKVTTFGSKLYKDFIPNFTAPTVDRLLQSGCIMHARTTTPEFAYSDACHSPLWGITKNPWNQDYSPGGSSGGAGAALAAGMTTLADGTDGGGSIRIPASACGVVGYKPPFGRNPLDCDHPMESILVYGPMARTVSDAALMQNVMSGIHVDDVCSLRESIKIPLPEQLGSIKNWRIGFSMNLGYIEVDPEVQTLTMEALNTFKDLGCDIEEVHVGWDWRVYKTWITYWESLFSATSGHLIEHGRNQLDPFVVQLLEHGKNHSAETLHQCRHFRGEMYKSLAPILEKYDVLIVPTTALPSVKADHSGFNSDFQINGHHVPAYVGWVLTHGFNLMSYCPVLSVPSGRSKCGVPTGIQIIGRSFDDIRVFQAAQAYAAARPWNYEPLIHA
ncbi:MAG: hypothetical protein A2622_05935 [Bdellovibrionales bacterium RIFCSPHIGHO2_01_FULL_40_29]|nr:MAG: hypothetical protein A2622_05935 [Bdellovibrionales bacterium RIFCSPHIGHO2_01_FULL_40_29]OFZ34993.1 MAG: hypothetical protein A3D17_06285 [Bdellovibrionales bacterium RIFCSPHIGHO2_02_FULL_40_15]